MSGIRLEHIRKSYGSFVAVGDVSLTVAPEEFVTLLGPSGSGKTTTLRMIAGLETPTSGTIRIGERKVFDQTALVPTSRRNLGMVFQSYAVWPHKTVFGNVAFPLKQRGITGTEAERRVMEMLAMVELDGLDRRYPSELSGGQQQRVALARALVAQPEVVLFDEPLSNLDAQLRESMRGLLLALHQRFRFTAIYVTHDQTEAMMLSDRVYVMNKGAIVQSGPPRALYERPENLFVAQFIGQANVLSIAESHGGTVRLHGGLALRVRSDKLGASVVIRPHSVQLVRNEAPAENVFPATVLQSVYLGDRASYVLDLGSDTTVAMELVIGPALPATGDQIRVRLPAEECVVI